MWAALALAYPSPACVTSVPLLLMPVCRALLQDCVVVSDYREWEFLSMTFFMTADQCLRLARGECGLGAWGCRVAGHCSACPTPPVCNNILLYCEASRLPAAARWPGM